LNRQDAKDAKPGVFAERTRWDMTPTRLAAALERRRAAGLPVLDLTESNPTRCGLVPDAAFVLGLFARSANLRYDPVAMGLPEARAAVSAYYGAKGVGLAADRVCLTASTSEAYAFLFRLLADPGDEVLVPRPSYPLLEFLAGLNDVRLVPYPLVYGDRGWRIGLKNLRDAVGPRTRAVVAVSPNNPTGSFLRRNERDALVELCAAHGLALVADEVFADYAFEPEGDPPPTLAGTDGALTFVLSGISKVLALPQLKLAWIAASGPDDLLRDALGRLEVIADTYLSVATPIQRALPALLARRAEIQGRILARLQANRRTLEDLSPGGPVEVLPVEGGWYAVLRLRGLRDEEAWAVTLLERDGVHVHPGYLFDFAEPGHIVMSLLPGEEVFAEGISRLLARAWPGP
jgi:aspartate/methionine/tyrosine aminotransferase